MSDLGENIRKRRQYLNMTQGQLAEKMGYADKGMISRIENGKIGLSKEKIEKFAEVLRISPVELMGYVFEPGLQREIDEYEAYRKYVRQDVEKYNSLSEKMVIEFDKSTEKGNTTYAIMDILKNSDEETLKRILSYAKYLDSTKEGD